MRIECDRCKKIYDANSRNEIYISKDGKANYIVSRIDFDGIYTIGDDMSNKYLCPECTHKLREWIKNG